MPTLSLGFSPCPNDTFLFYALVHKKINTYGIDIKCHIADVEELNRSAFAGDLDITKLSYHALGYLLPHYQLLYAGSALGNNCGPLLIAKQPITQAQLSQATIAIPGKYTTANFLLSWAMPEVQDKIPMLFSDIETAVLQNKVDAGLIIHENRFTYAQKGLIKLIDLGQYWEEKTQLPIPLGGIAVKRSLPGSIKRNINNMVRESVIYAFSHPEETEQYVRQYAQEMDIQVIYQHIQLYVNAFSADLGLKGEQAVRYLFRQANELNLIPPFSGEVLIQR